MARVELTRIFESLWKSAHKYFEVWTKVENLYKLSYFTTTSNVLLEFNMSNC